MKRTTVMLPDEMDERLRREARRRGLSIAELTREVIESGLPPAPPAGAPLSFFAVGKGGPQDVAGRAERFVADAVERREQSDRRGA